METWKYWKLKDLGRIVAGDTPDTKNSDFYNGSIPWITPKDLSGRESRYISRGERSITDAGFRSCALHMLPEHSVLITSRAPIGNLAINPCPVCTSQGFRSIVPNERVDYRFLYYLLERNREKITAMGGGSIYKEISASALGDVEVLLPEDRQTQRRIADLLDSIDSKRELLYEINKNLAKMIEKIFAMRFEAIGGNEGRKGSGLPARSGKEETGGNVLLGEVAELHTEAFYPQKIPERILENYSIPAYDKGKFPEFTMSGDLKSAKYKIDRDCIMISKLNPHKKRVWMPYCLTDLSICTTEFIVYKAKNPMHKLFLFSLISGDDFQKFLASHVTGSSRSRQRVSPKETLRYGFVLPAEKEIVDYTRQVQPLFALEEKNYLERENLRKLKNYLLLRLIKE